MHVFEAQSLDDLVRFPKDPARLGLMRRSAPLGAERYFETLTRAPFRLSGTVHRTTAEQDVLRLLDAAVPAELQADPFHADWTFDMASVCRGVSDMLDTDTVRFRLDMARRCRRYHVDNISFRTVVAYSGAGTEYLDEAGADRDAYEAGADNDRIVIDPTCIRHINGWDIAVIRGGPNGLLHKTPEAAMERPSVFLRVDPPEDPDTA